MSEHKINLAVHILKDLFGEDASRIGRHLCLWPDCSVQDIDLEKKFDCLALFSQHNFLTFQKSPRSGLNEFTLSIDDVLLCLKYPRYVYSMKNCFGDIAENIVMKLLENGRLCASEILLAVFKEKGSETTRQDLKEAYETFCDMVQNHYLREHSNCSSKSFSALPLEKKKPLFDKPTLELSNIIEKLKDPDKDVLFLDAKRLWQINHNRFLRNIRDDVIATAVRRRIDEHAGSLMRLLLDIVKSDYDDTCSNRFYFTDINDGVKASHFEQLKKHFGQYMRLLEEDQTRFIDKVGDEGGGAFQINFKHVFRELAIATVENVIMEKFSSKALRIFRYYRS